MLQWVHPRYVCKAMKVPLSCAGLMITVAGMSYLYGTRFVGSYTPLVSALRNEIYVQPYESIKWSKQRDNISPLDVYCPHHPIFNFLNQILIPYENLPWTPISSYLPVRELANKRAYQIVKYEDENTNYQTIGPVTKALFIVCRFAAEGPDSAAFRDGQQKVRDFLWLSKDGLFMTGTNGSQLWDIAFIAQAVVETGLADEEENQKVVSGSLDWLDKAQIRGNPKWYKESFRHRTKGAWAFSTPEQSFVVSHYVRWSG